MIAESEMPLNLLAGTITQSVTADASIGAEFTFSDHQKFKILYGFLQAGTFGAGREIKINLLKGSAVLATLASATLTSGQQMGFANRLPVGVSTATHIGLPENHWLSKDYKLRIYGASLANAETIVFEMGLLIFGTSPATIVPNGTGVTIPDVVNKFV